MALLLTFAFVAGTLTVISPCTLPVLPILLGSATGDGRWRVGGMLVGFAGTFIAVTVLLASTLATLGLTTDRLRLLSALIVVVAGASLAVPALGRWVEARGAPLTRLGIGLAGGGDTAASRAGNGIGPGLLLGVAIGLIWAPCVGPIMAAVVAVAVTSGPSGTSLLVATAYVAGAAVPLSLVALAGRRATRTAGSARGRATVQRWFGTGMVAVGLVVATGLDLPLQAAASRLLPDAWGSALVAVEQQPGVEDALRQMDPSSATLGGAAAAPPAGVAAGGPQPAGPQPAVPLPAAIASRLPTVRLDDLGQAPELTGISDWINSPPLDLASLRGKVVLVHFWTFGCINCIHVQPYVKAWYDRYADAGLVVIGVHTPELSFERDIANVRTAVADDGVRFPVAVDPTYATWYAYGNQHWPAFYFVDRRGRIRHTHFGEGDYDGSEQVIRELLAQPA